MAGIGRAKLSQATIQATSLFTMATTCGPGPLSKVLHRGRELMMLNAWHWSPQKGTKTQKTNNHRVDLQM